MAANLVRSRFVARGSDRGLYEIIVGGIPGTEMPPQPELGENQVWQVVSYLHSLARPGLQPPVSGNPDVGRYMFRTAGCSECHRVDGEGGFWGPPLDTIAARKKADEIRMDVLEPGKEVAEGYRKVIVATKAGEVLEGLLKNQDTFSVQVLMRDGFFSLLSREDIREINISPDSPMPADYDKRFDSEQLQDLLAFLDGQRDPFVPYERGFQNY